MKIDDPKLTAYALGELNAEDTRAVKKAIDADPALTQEVKAIEEMAQMISQGYQKAEPTLSAAQRSKVFAAGASSNIEDISSLRQRAGWKTWTAASVGIAAAVAVTLSVVQHTDPNSHSPTDSYADFSYDEMSAPFSTNNAEWDSKSGSVAIPAQLSKLAQVAKTEPKEFKETLLEKAADQDTPETKGEYSESSWVATSEQNSTSVPLVSGAMSWQWVMSALDSNQAIHPALIRTEEIINHFQQPFTADFKIDSLSTSLQFMKSPWNDQTVLAVVQLKNSGETLIKDVSAGIVFEPSVKEFRVVGYRDSDNNQGNTSPNIINMEPGYAHTVIYELKLDNAPTTSSVLASLQLKSGDQQKSINYEYAQQSILETDLSASIPAVVAFWSQWVAKSDNINQTTAVAQLQNEFAQLMPKVKDAKLKKALQQMQQTLK